MTELKQNCIHCSNHSSELRKAKLQLEKENAELSNSVTELVNSKTELEKENTELKAELEKWKSEWNEQVIKANDEGYARTLQGIEIEKLKAQIKKMRCCGNCRNNGMNCIWFKNHNKECKNLDKWEFGE